MVDGHGQKPGVGGQIEPGKGKIGAPASITKTLFEHPLLYGLFRGDYAGARYFVSR